MILTGIARIGRDAEVRYAPDGTPVANLSLAYNYGKKDAQGNRPTTWIDASLWGERATKLAEYLKKGQQLCVVLDDVHVNVYQKGDGSTGTSLKARVSSIEFAGSRADSAASSQIKPDAPGGAKERAPAAAGGPASKFDDLEEDIPF